MASQLGGKAGVAVRPVMDLSDGRVIAYRALPRGTASREDPADFLDAALAIAALTAPAPLLVPVEERLLLRATFDPLERARAAKCVPSEVVWMMPEPRTHSAAVAGTASASALAEAIRRHSSRLRSAGYRIGLEGFGALTVAWEDVVAVAPAFLVLREELTRSLNDEAERAALVGLLAFAGQVGARVVVEHIEEPGHAASLMASGIFYGTGDHLHQPVVLDEQVALPGDLVVRPSWFRERSVRRLPEVTTDGNVLYRPVVPRRAITDDRRLATLLAEWSGAMSNADSASDVLDLLAQLMPQVVTFDRMAVFEADWDRYLLVPRVLVGEDLQGLAESSTTINTGITGWAFLRGSPYLCARTSDHPEAAPILGQPEADESMIVIPMISGIRRLGVLDLWQDGTDQYSEADLERVALAARHAANAWRSAVDRDELAERVVTDTATGLLNKRWWDELAPREAAQAERASTTIAILLVDLDGFKSVNDSFGHAAGDAALKQVARALTDAVRSGDAVVRYGGDEFVLMLRDCDEAGSTDVATDVRLALDQVQLPGDLSLSASIGIALFPRDGPALADVAARADTAMYLAKARGGGRTSVYSAGDEDRVRTISRGGPSEGAGAGVPGASPVTHDDGAPLRRGSHPNITQELTDDFRRLRYAEQLAAVGSFEMDLTTGRVEWSDELRRIIAADAETTPTLAAIVERVHPDDFDRYSEAIAAWAQGGWGRFEMQLALIAPNGERREAYLRQIIRPLDDGRRVLSGTLQELPPLA